MMIYMKKNGHDKMIHKSIYSS